MKDLLNLLIIGLGVVGSIFIISIRDYLRINNLFTSRLNLFTSSLIGIMIGIVAMKIIEPSELIMFVLVTSSITLLYYKVGKQDV